MANIATLDTLRARDQESPLRLTPSFPSVTIAVRPSASDIISGKKPAQAPKFSQLQTNVITRERNKLCKEVALAALKELIFSCACAAVTAFFVAGPLAIALLFVASVITVIVNAGFRAAPRYYQYQIFKDGYKTRNRTQEDEEQLANYKMKLASATYIANWFCPGALATTEYLKGTGTLIHETGHYLAVKALYEKGNPTMSVVPFGDGVTKYKISPLSGLGKCIGASGADNIVAGAGAGVVVLLSAIAIGVAHKYKKKNVYLSRSLLVGAITAIAHHVFYALSALGEVITKKTGHDFIRLWAGGVHPIISVIAIIAIPLIVKGSMMLYDYCKNRPQTISSPSVPIARLA